MTDEGLDFSEVLKEAQAHGYAEADPTLDIEGMDSAHKLQILATLAFRTAVDLKDIYTEGITARHRSRTSTTRASSATASSSSPSPRRGDGGAGGARAPHDDPRRLADGRGLRRLQRRLHHRRQRRRPHVLRPRRRPAARPPRRCGRTRSRSPGGSPTACPRSTSTCPRSGRRRCRCAPMDDDPLRLLPARHGAWTGRACSPQVAGILGEHDISLVSVLQKGRARRARRCRW